MPKVKHSIFSTHKLFTGFYDLIRARECSQSEWCLQACALPPRGTGPHRLTVHNTNDDGRTAGVNEWVGHHLDVKLCKGKFSPLWVSSVFLTVWFVLLRLLYYQSRVKNKSVKYSVLLLSDPVVGALSTMWVCTSWSLIWQCLISCISFGWLSSLDLPAMVTPFLTPAIIIF